MPKTTTEIPEEETPAATDAVMTDEQPKKIDEWIAFLRDIVIILALVVFIRTYVAAPFRISGSSMEDNYHNNEFIIVDKFSYADFGAFKVGDPKRGDVVIIRPHADNGREFYIKRVIGLPGDEIKIEDGWVYLKKPDAKNFVRLNETYLSAANYGKTLPGRTSKDSSFVVPENQYLLLGDNRNGSADSRDCFYSCTLGNTTHYIHRDDIIGKLWSDLGSVRIFQKFELSPSVSVKLSENIGFDYPPRFLSTPRDWDYKELQ